MSTCQEVRPLISAELDGESTAAERTSLASHLVACEECRDMKAALAQLDRSLWSHFRSVELGEDERAQVRRTLSRQLGQPSRPRLRTVAPVLLAAATILALISLWLRSPPPPAAPSSQLVVLRPGELINVELGGCSRFVCLGPGAYTTSSAPADNCHRAIALIAGTLEVEHLSTDDSINIRLPDGIFSLDHGLARLEVALPDARRQPSRILLLSGAARYAGSDDSFALTPGVAAWIGGAHTEIVAALSEPEREPLRTSSELPPGVDLVDEDGRPVADVAALLSWRKREGLGFALAALQSDGQGHLALSRTAADAQARLDLAATASTVARRVYLSQTQPGEKIVLAAGGQLVGRVVDSDGRAVADALVTVRSDDGLAGIPLFDGGSRVVSTAADGSFHVAAIGPVFLATATLPGFAPVTTLRGVVRNHEVKSNVVLRIVRAGRVEGVVVNEAGLPVPGALINVQQEPSLPRLPMDFEEIAPPSLSATADARGRFVIDDVPSDLPLWSWARAGSHLNSGVTRFNLQAGGRHELDFVLPEAFAISGRVRSARGEPIARALIHVLGGDDAQSRRASLPTLSAADGGFRVDGLGSGAKLVIVKADGFAPALVECELSGPPRDQEVTVVAEPALTLRGQVLGPQSEPVALVTLSLAPRDRLLASWASPILQALLGLGEVTADEQGHFTLGGLRPGSYQLLMSDAGLAVGEQEVEIADAETHVEARITRTAPRARLDLTIATAAGTPPPALVVEGSRLPDENDSAGRSPISFRQSIKASVAKTTLVCIPGRYVLTVRAPHFPNAVTAPIAIADSTSLLLTLSEPADLRVHFRDPSGNDVTNVIVAIEDADGRPVMARVGAEGRPLTTWSTGSGCSTRATELPAGASLILTATRPGGDKTHVPFVPVANELTQLDVVVP